MGSRQLSQPLTKFSSESCHRCPQRAHGKYCPPAHILEGVQMLLIFPVAKTRDRKGRGVVRDVPANRAFPSGCTGSVSLQKKPRTPPSAKAEDIDSSHHYCPARCSQNTRLQVDSRTTNCCSIPPGTKDWSPQLAGASLATCPPPSAWPFKSRRGPTANTGPYCQHKASNRTPWGPSEK